MNLKLAFILNETKEYTENQTINITQSGTYQIELFGASGSGGNCKTQREGNSDGTITLRIGSGSGGGGGGYAFIKTKMVAENDQISFIAGKIGEETKATILHNSKDNIITISAAQDGEDGVSYISTPDGVSGGPNGGSGGKVSYNSDHNFDEIITQDGLEGAKGENKYDTIEPKSGDYVQISDSLGGAGGYSGINNGGNGAGGINYQTTEKLNTPGSGQDGFIKITLIEEDITIDPETPPSGGDIIDPETPSQPSTTISNILTADSIQALKKRVYDELADRKFYGAISSVANQINYNSLDSTIATANEINTDIISPLNLIDNKLIQENINNPIRYSYINDQLDIFEDCDDSQDPITKKYNNGCRQICTGFCSGYCAEKCTTTCVTDCNKTCQGKNKEQTSGSVSSGCSGCTGSCTQDCGNCTITCGGGCQNGCKHTCINTATDTCGACYKSCNEQCTDLCHRICSGGCKDNCEGTCKGGCDDTGEALVIGCGGNCLGCTVECKGGCASNCSHNCASNCSDICRNACQEGCSATATQST